MKSTCMHLARAPVPAVALGALMATGTASAAPTWRYSGGPHGSGAASFRAEGVQLKVCDVNSDGYNDNKCTTVSEASGRHNLAEKRFYRLRACVIKAGQSPSYCKTTATIYNGR